ncbi:MAG: hypothetical protein NTX50_05800 [Candidatus Sumerlaeota bacterium]|nr:hypothetical protein [Candidatus Sumerlaeota bacterium]
MSETKSEKSLRSRVILTAGVAGVALAVNLFIVLRVITPESLSAEAIVRSSIARELSQPGSRGYHALISSCLMAPLPTLGSAPLVWINEWQNGIAFYILSSILSAIAALYMVALARSFSLPAPWICGLALAIALLFNPWTPLAAWRGSSATGSLLFATAIGAHFVAWLKRDKWFSLGLSAGFLASALIWDVRFTPVALLGASIVAGHAGALARRERRAAIQAAAAAAAAAQGAPLAAPQALAVPAAIVAPAGGKRRVEGSLIVFLAPIVYIPGIWVLFNWLIFGDAQRMFRDLPLFKGMILHLAQYGAAAMAVCYLATRFAPLGRLAAAAVYGLGVAGLIWLAVSPVSPAMAAIVGTKPDTASYSQSLEDLRRYLRESYGGRLALVIGRPGYLAQRQLGPCTQFIHYLDLMSIEGILKDSPGRELILILSEPQRERYYAQFGKDRWDLFFVADERFGPWQAFFCVRAAGNSSAQGKSSIPE